MAFLSLAELLCRREERFNGPDFVLMGALLGGYALPVVFIRGDLCLMREEGCTGDVTFMIGSVTKFFMPTSSSQRRRRVERRRRC